MPVHDAASMLQLLSSHSAAIAADLESPVSCFLCALFRDGVVAVAIATPNRVIGPA